MFSGLRLRLSLLYALSALALVALIGGGAYLVVASYFRDVTDLALQHKMTHEFHALAAPIPPELAGADRDWSLLRSESGFLQQRRTASGISEDDEADARDGDDDTTAAAEPSAGEILAYDGELAAIFVLPLDRDGQLLFDPNPAVPPAPDLSALQAALSDGSDVRTVVLPDGRDVRLLTYPLTRSDGPAALQLGRVLGDQEQVLRQLMIGLLALGSLSMMLVGAGSWWLAGRALRPAQDAWERQQRFVASASHELRTPLTLIRASAEVALRGTAPDNADQRELLGDVISESDHMRRLVNDLLTLSRLDSGQLPLSVTLIDLSVLLTEIQRKTARLGAEREVTVALGAVAGTLNADPDWLRQVLLILLDNALRHTPAGGQIVLAAVVQGRGVCLSVADSGCGIAPEHLPHIFERFYRADPARSREGGNAGLGLAIAKGLVEAMGGQVGAASEPGRGTRIWLSFPHA